MQHPYIGIRYELITDEVRKAERLPVKEGVVVRSVYADGPCGKAGIKPEDIIVAVDGKQLKDTSSMSDYIDKQDIGKVINLQVKRWDDQRGAWKDLNIHATIEDMPKNFVHDMSPNTTPNNGEGTQPMPNDNGGNNNGGNGNRGSNPFPFPFPF